jgi:hypothetical protein
VTSVPIEPGVIRVQLHPSGENFDGLSIFAQVGIPPSGPDQGLGAVRIGFQVGQSLRELLFPSTANVVGEFWREEGLAQEGNGLGPFREGSPERRGIDLRGR